MSFIINQNFDLKSPQFNFARDYYADLAALKTACGGNWGNYSSFPDHFITNVGGTLYQYTSGNSVDTNTGKWRKLEFGVTNAAFQTALNTVKDKALAAEEKAEAAGTQASKNADDIKVLNGNLANKADISYVKALAQNSSIKHDTNSSDAKSISLVLANAIEGTTGIDESIEIPTVTENLNGLMTPTHVSNIDTALKTANANKQGIQTITSNLDAKLNKSDVENALNDKSTNPVQNKVVTEALTSFNNALNDKASKAVATTTTDGLLSSTDKAKLNNLDANASSTYASKSEVSSTYATKNDVSNTYLAKSEIQTLSDDDIDALWNGATA